jgi:hypothetical protein
MLATALPALAIQSLIQVSSDPYSNSDSQHMTQVEPGAFTFGSTVISAFQSGRYFTGGSSNIGFATSTDRGLTWTHGFLPGTTDKATPPGNYQRASDASVAYDARDKVWLISDLLILTPNPSDESTFRVDVAVSRSTDGGRTWGSPIIVNPNPGQSFLDKNWTVCDNTATSPFYGHCYTEFDDTTRNDLLQISTSTDGGLTWNAPVTTADPTNGFSIPSGTPGAHGLGGQPMVQPDGHVVVPYVGFDIFFNPNFSYSQSISSTVSVDGGVSFSASAVVNGIDQAAVPGGIRANTPLPSADNDESGKMYVTWADCRFEPQCNTNDLVLSTSTNGTAWSATQRIPLDPIGSGADHFLPGLGVDHASSGKSAHVALVYYFYPQGNCSAASCQLDVGFTSSRNGGASWSPHETLAGPITLSWLPQTNQGVMVGDYFASPIPSSSTVALPMFMVASPPTETTFHEPTFTVREKFSGGNAAAGSASATSALPIAADPVLAHAAKVAPTKLPTVN